MEITSQYQAAIAKVPMMSLPVELPGLEVSSTFYSFYLYVCCCCCIVVIQSTVHKKMFMTVIRLYCYCAKRNGEGVCV